MKKCFKLFLAAAFLVTEFFVVALPLMMTSARSHQLKLMVIQYKQLHTLVLVVELMLLLE